MSILLSVGFSAYAQHRPACDSIQKNKSFTGFCYEYLDKSMVATKPSLGKLQTVVFYEKGKKSKEYPSQFLNAKDKLYRNDTLLPLDGSSSLMHGMYTIKDKDGKITENLLYKDGFITKHVTRYESILKKKRVGETVHEIAEYDYSVFPFVKHYIYYTKPGVIKDNYYTVYRDSSWKTENTTEQLSDTLTTFKGYSKK
jgi:hypothetical protein